MARCLCVLGSEGAGAIGNIQELHSDKYKQLVVSDASKGGIRNQDIDNFFEYESMMKSQQEQYTLESLKHDTSKNSQIIKRMLIFPIEGISEELEKDLAQNEGEKIIKRQGIRKMDQEYSEFFENVSVAPLIFQKGRARFAKKKISRDLSKGKQAFSHRKTNLSFNASTLSSVAPSCLLKEKEQNPYSYQHSENSIGTDQQDYQINYHKANNKKHRRSTTSKISHNKGAYNDRSRDMYDKNKIFKEMDIKELVRHRFGLLNLYHDPKMQPSGMVSI